MEPTGTRRLLVTPYEDNRTLFALLRGGRELAEAEELAGPARKRDNASVATLSSDAWSARKPPHPVELLGALQDVQPLSEGHLVSRKLLRPSGGERKPRKSPYCGS